MLSPNRFVTNAGGLQSVTGHQLKYSKLSHPKMNCGIGNSFISVNLLLGNIFVPHLIITTVKTEKAANHS